MTSIRWIRSATIDGEPCTFEIMVGVDRIGDRCYVRINREPEQWFRPGYDTREDIVAQGIRILQARLQDHQVRNADGTPFIWE